MVIRGVHKSQKSCTPVYVNQKSIREFTKTVSINHVTLAKRLNFFEKIVTVASRKRGEMFNFIKKNLFPTNSPFFIMQNCWKHNTDFNKTSIQTRGSHPVVLKANSTRTVSLLRPSLPKA